MVTCHQIAYLLQCEDGGQNIFKCAKTDTVLGYLWGDSQENTGPNVVQNYITLFIYSGIPKFSKIPKCQTGF